MKIIKCDTCRKTLEEGELIELGSENQMSLYFRNDLPVVKNPGEIISISRYKNLHFCSKEHFVDYFFNNQDRISENNKS